MDMKILLGERLKDARVVLIPKELVRIR